MKQLCILRHAEAIPPEQASDDLSRALTVFGQRQCADRAARLPDAHFDLILASPAARTRETARIIFAGRGRIVPDTKLYNATRAMLSTIVALTGEDISSLALVGHNPGMSELAEFLTGERRHLPPASLMIFEVAGDWAAIGRDSARLTAAMLD